MKKFFKKYGVLLGFVGFLLVGAAVALTILTNGAVYEYQGQLLSFTTKLELPGLLCLFGGDKDITNTTTTGSNVTTLQVAFSSLYGGEMKPAVVVIIGFVCLCLGAVTSLVCFVGMAIKKDVRLVGLIACILGIAGGVIIFLTPGLITSANESMKNTEYVVSAFWVIAAICAFLGSLVTLVTAFGKGKGKGK